MMIVENVDEDVNEDVDDEYEGRAINEMKYRAKMTDYRSVKNENCVQNKMSLLEPKKDVNPPQHCLLLSMRSNASMNRVACRSSYRKATNLSPSFLQISTKF